jgi:hypothetical protein
VQAGRDDPTRRELGPHDRRLWCRRRAEHPGRAYRPGGPRRVRRCRKLHPADACRFHGAVHRPGRRRRLPRGLFGQAPRVPRGHRRPHVRRLLVRAARVPDRRDHLRGRRLRRDSFHRHLGLQPRADQGV